MNQEYFCAPRSGKLLHQLPTGVTFAYDLCLGHSRDRWKGHPKEHSSENGIHHELKYGVP